MREMIGQLTKPALIGVLALTGCATYRLRKEPPAGGVVATFRQGTAATNANIYWFETPAGPVIIDSPMTLTETGRLKDALERPYRIYITSAKPERFGGLDSLRKPDVPAFTTPAVATEIQSYGNSRLAPFHKRFGADVPAAITPPTPAIEERTNDMVGEVEIELLPLGPAESEASLALFLPKTRELITGDVVAGAQHLDLTWGRSVAWQDRINELKALEPKFVYPGHGEPGGIELLEANLAYLKFFHDTVAEKVKPGAPAKIARNDFEDVKRRMKAKFREYGREELLDRSIPAEYAVQLAALPPTTAPETATAGAPNQTPSAVAPAPATTPGAKPAPAAKPADPKAPAAKPAAPAATTTKTEPAPAATPATPAATKDEKPAKGGKAAKPASGKSVVDDMLNDVPSKKKGKKK